MQETVSSPSSSPEKSFSENEAIIAAAIIGLAMGGVFCWLSSLSTIDPVGLGIVTFTLVLGASLLLTWPVRPVRGVMIRGFVAALTLAFLLGGSTYWIVSVFQGSARMFELWHLYALFVGYVAIAFIQCWTENGTLRFPYVDLARHAWSNAFVAATGMALCGAFWLLLLLWMQLFELLEIDFFSDLFRDKYFILSVTPAVCAIGVALGRRKEEIIDTLLGVAMILCRFLLPLASVLSIVFLATLAVKGLAPLWETGKATPLLIGMIVTLIFLVNAATQALPDTPLLPKPLRYLTNVALILLPVYAALAAYATGLRIGQHGLMPDRIRACVFIALAAAYCLGYVGVVLFSKDGWLSGVRKVNPPLAVLSAAVIWFISLPVVPLQRISAEDQVSRLLNGKVAVDKFDAWALRVHLGEPGKEALAGLAERARNENHPQAAKIAEIIENRSSARQDKAETVEDFRDRITENPFLHVTVLPAGTVVDAATMAALRIAAYPRQYSSCTENAPCVLVAATLDARTPDKPVYIWFADSNRTRAIALAMGQEKAWVIGTVRIDGERAVRGASLIQRLGDQGFSVVESRYREMVSGGISIRIVPDRGYAEEDPE